VVKVVNQISYAALYRLSTAKKLEVMRMNIKKQLMMISAGMLLLVATAPSHAGGVYGNVGYHEYPWSIVIGYSDYGRSYNRGHRHGYRHGHHYKYKKRYYKRHYKHHRDYGHHYGHRKHRYDRYRDRYYARHYRHKDRHEIRRDRHYRDDRYRDRRHRDRDGDRRDRRDRR